MKRVLLFLIAFLLIPTLVQGQERQLVDRVIAVVNNEVITQSELDVIFLPIYEQIKATYQGPELQKELSDIRLKLLNQLIEDKLVYQESEKLGIEVAPYEVAEQLEAFKSQFPDAKALEAQMKRAGVTDAILSEQFRERLAISRLHDRVIRGKVIVSPGEVEQYFQDHPDEFVQKEQVEVWSITIPKSEEAIEKGLTDEAARAKAERLLVRLNRGVDFDALARKYSDDVGREHGGHLGFVPRGMFVDDVDKVIFSLSSGSLSEVVETERGYHIFKIGTKKAEKVKTFEEAREEIREVIFRTKAHERFVDWMKELKKRSYISVR